MRSDPPIDRKALEIHHNAVVIDLHADTATLLRFGYDIFSHHHPPLPMAAFGFHLDVPRMKKGGLTAQFFGLVTFPLTRVGLLDSATQQINLVEQGCLKRPDLLTLTTEAQQIEAAKVDGRVAALFGLEGAQALEGKIENLHKLASKGLRYIGLAHFTKNKAAHPAMGLGSSKSKGLSQFGRDVVEHSNELGVLVDLAHINKKGFMEAIKLSTDPVIVSHTGLSGVHKLWRNIDDEQVRSVADTGGCIGIIFSRHFLGGRHLSSLADHILHCVRVGGEDCPALGSDFDGLIVPPRELPDVAALPRLTQELLHCGLKKRVIHKILGGNVIRVLRQVPARHYLNHTHPHTAS